MFNDIKKILVFKLCCLGDAVFITPAVKSLRENFPDSKIIYAHSKWIEPLMDYIPEIDGTILFEHVFSGNIFKKIYGTLKFILKVRKEKFDLVFFGHRSNTLSLILMMCGIKYRIGFRPTKHLTHTGVFRSELPEFRRYLHLLSENGLKVQDMPPKLKPHCRDGIRKKLNLDSKTKLLGVFPMGGSNPGTVMHIKRWNIENYFKLLFLINNSFPDLKIIIFEGKIDDEKIILPSELTASVRLIDNDILSACDYFISGDTGSLHIAAAMGVSTLALFGPSDPRILAPVNITAFGAKHSYIWKMPPCSPCYTPDTAFDKKNGKYWHTINFICHTGTHECIRAIMPEEVFNEFRILIQNSN